MAFPWGALISAGGSIFGGMAMGRGMAEYGRIGQLSQKDQLEIGSMRGREQDKGILAGGIDRGISPFLNLPFQMEQERKAFNYSLGPGRDLKRSQDVRDKERELAFRSSPAFGAMKRRQLNRRIKEMKAKMAFSPDAMRYGPIAFRRTV
tara:strand:+ start:307 stop:753 length:447 start_codon:yes stop_codon:yes gene_type:complete